MLTVSEVIEHLERLAPPRLAADWDNVGLLLGRRDARVERLMTCLTVTPDSTAEALERRADLIVTHHPILFKAVRRLTADTSEGEALLALAHAGVAVYSPHTAFDNAPGGINDLLASKLGLVDVTPLRRMPGPRQVKFVVFVPDSDLARVSDALFAAGAGRIGEYSDCSFRLSGTGTFFGSEATQPTVGQKGRREEAAEWRLEVVCPEARVPAIVQAMRQAHSYEEPAFDLYPLMPAPSASGEGRLGRLGQPATLSALADHLRRALGCAAIAVVGEPERSVHRVAVACGAAGEFLGDAVAARADLFVTGEMRFHDLLAAQARGIAVLLPGHYATERCGVEDLARRLKGQWPTLDVWASVRESDPVQMIGMGGQQTG